MPCSKIPRQSLLKERREFLILSPCSAFPVRIWTGKTLKIQCFKTSVNQPHHSFPDGCGHQDASDSQGGGTLNDQDDLSDQSDGESYSYSAPGGEPLSRDPSEPLFDADFQVGNLNVDLMNDHVFSLYRLYHMTDCKRSRGCKCLLLYTASIYYRFIKIWLTLFFSNTKTQSDIIHKRPKQYSTWNFAAWIFHIFANVPSQSLTSWETGVGRARCY